MRNLRMAIAGARRRLAALELLGRMLRGAETGEDWVGRWAGWPDIVELAVEADVAPSLWCALQARGHSIPPVAAERLHDTYRANTLRNGRLRRQLVEAVTSLNRAGVTPLLFKGALELVDDSRERAGERLMEDLDLVVPQGELAQAVKALEAIGYRPANMGSEPAPHDLPMVRERAAGPIDLHVEIGGPQLARVLPVAEAWAQSEPLGFDGVTARGLSPTHQVLHRITHSAVQDRNHAVGDLPLGQLLVLSQLVAAHDSSIDWRMIHDRMRARGLSRQLAGQLWLAHRVTGLPLPAPARAGGAGRRVHEVRALIGFTLPWLTQVQRNVRHTLGSDNLDAVYAHNGHPLALALARARHIVLILRRDGSSVLHKAARGPL